MSAGRIEHGLSREIELRRQLHRLGVLEAETRLHVVEAAFDRERGGRQHGRRAVADDRRSARCCDTSIGAARSGHAAAARFDVVDERRVVGGQHDLQVVGQRRRPVGDGRQCPRSARAARCSMATTAIERLARARRPRPHNRSSAAGVSVSRSPPSPGSRSSSRAASNSRRHACCTSDAAGASATPPAARSPGRRPGRLRRVARRIHPRGACRPTTPKYIVDDILELVRFVDHGEIAVRNDFAEAALPHRRIGAEQVVVDDDEVGLGGALLHARDEAVRCSAGIRGPGTARSWRSLRSTAAGRRACLRFRRGRPWPSPAAHSAIAREPAPIGAGRPASASRRRSKRCRHR